MIDFDALVLRPCQETFAVPIVFTPKDGPSYPMKAIFKSDFAAVDSGGEMVVQGRAPVLGFRQTDLAAMGLARPSRGDTVVVKCVTYEVTAAEPDSEGDVQVHLVVA